MNREKKKALNEESIRMMHRIFDAEMIGYAYLYPNDGGARQESVLATTPENLANYVGSHFLDAEKMVITDMCDRLILDTYGGFINQCPNQNLCMEINRYLAPIQMGDKEAGEILIVSRDAAEAYFAMEDEAVGMAEFLLKKMQENGLISAEEREKITVLNIETFSPELAEVYL